MASHHTNFVEPPSQRRMGSQTSCQWGKDFGLPNSRHSCMVQWKYIMIMSQWFETESSSYHSNYWCHKSLWHYSHFRIIEDKGKTIIPIQDTKISIICTSNSGELHPCFAGLSACAWVAKSKTKVWTFLIIVQAIGNSLLCHAMVPYALFCPFLGHTCQVFTVHLRIHGGWIISYCSHNVYVLDRTSENLAVKKVCIAPITISAMLPASNSASLRELWPSTTSCISVAVKVLPIVHVALFWRWPEACPKCNQHFSF